MAKRGSGRVSRKHCCLHKLEEGFVWSKANISPSSSLVFILILTLVSLLQTWHSHPRK